MSWQIPTQVEQDIIAGKAKYQTFQTGHGGQSILPVPPNSYVVIFGYDFSPAGGGLVIVNNDITNAADAQSATTASITPFETQQISFYTGTDFYPFIHHVNVESSPFIQSINALNPAEEITEKLRLTNTVDNTSIARQIYITSSNDVTITVGLIRTSLANTINAIPITSRTPQGLTYGGSAQVVNTQTDFGPAATPLQFMQPSPKDFQDFAFGLLPANADGQAFATPDITRGLIDPTTYLGLLGAFFRNAPACNYYLCLHYAIYSKTIPEQRP